MPKFIRTAKYQEVAGDMLDDQHLKEEPQRAASLSVRKMEPR